MGKLISGHYGSEPNAESMAISLKECQWKLNMKPSDHVSVGPPKFFAKHFGASGRYLLFLTDDDDVKDDVIWKPGYYLLPLEAKDVLSALERHKGKMAGAGPKLPVRWETDDEAPSSIKERAMRWAQESQPLFFRCACEALDLRLYEPWALRRRWKARLRCPGRCQPPLSRFF